MSDLSDLPYVAIDVRGLQSGFKSHQGRGTGRYVQSLVEALLPLDPEGRLSFVADAGAELRGTTVRGDRRLSRIDGPSWMDSAGALAPHLRQHVAWPRALDRVPVDFVHFCSQTDAPFRCRKAYVVTVLDLIPHRLPALYARGKSALRYRLARWLERRALAGARGLVAISEYTRRDLATLLRIGTERIAVTPLGVDGSLVPASEETIAALRRRHSLPERYLLYVGGIDPRKNLGFLLEVAKRVIERHPEVELVLAGNYRDDPDFPPLVREIRRRGLEASVRLVGYVAEEELASLYSGAAVFVYPSLYEGFGLPPLEAMACGAPVVAANRTSLPEVLGTAAVLADPADVGEFSAAVLGLLDNADHRGLRSAAGLRRAAGYTWNAAARATLDAYREFHERADGAPLL